jgi:multidrug efflux pump subunit AcrA (membrane-fusion protein)
MIDKYHPGSSMKNHRMEGRMSYFRISLSLIFSVSLAAAASLSPLTRVAADPHIPDSPVFVKVAKIEKNFSSGYIERAGSLTAIKKVRISTEVGGTVERLFFERGDRVKKGQVLAEIGTSKIRLEVEHALTTLKAAEIQLQKIRKGSRSEEIAIAEAALEEADAALMEAGEHFKRVEALFGKSAVSKSEYDSAVRTVESARSRREAMAQHLSMAREGAREEDRAIAEAQAAQARAALALAQDRLSKSIIRSPVEGVVSHKAVEEGEVIIVPPGAPVAQIVDSSSLKVGAAVSEMDVVFVKEKSILKFTVDPIPGKTFSAEVTFISPAAEPTTRNYAIEMLVRDADKDMADGMTARVRIPRTEPGAIMIHPSALAEKEGLVGVYVAEQGKAVFRRVGVGGYRGDSVVISQGLVEGDLLITNPAAVKDGIRVSYGFLKQK